MQVRVLSGTDVATRVEMLELHRDPEEHGRVALLWLQPVPLSLLEEAGWALEILPRLGVVEQVARLENSELERKQHPSSEPLLRHLDVGDRARWNVAVERWRRDGHRRAHSDEECAHVGHELAVVTTPVLPCVYHQEHEAAEDEGAQHAELQNGAVPDAERVEVSWLHAAVRPIGVHKDEGECQCVGQPKEVDEDRTRAREDGEVTMRDDGLQRRHLCGIVRYGLGCRVEAVRHVFGGEIQAAHLAEPAPRVWARLILCHDRRPSRRAHAPNRRRRVRAYADRHVRTGVLESNRRQPRQEAAARAIRAQLMTPAYPGT